MDVLLLWRLTMARFIAEQLGTDVVVHVDLKASASSSISSSDAEPEGPKSDTSRIETLAEGVIWLNYDGHAQPKRLTIRLQNGQELGLDRFVIRQLAKKLGLACYRELRDQYLEFIAKLEKFGGLLPKP